ncbi:MAG: CHAT domain-containing protein [Saprospiraceae bacterium]|nr:CHAT domain-containing protein [Saprospiraceae bacterium]
MIGERQIFCYPVFILLLLFLSGCGAPSSPQGSQGAFSPEICHSFYQKTAGGSFRKADSLAYIQHFPAAASLFQQQSDTLSSPEEMRYAWLRLADLNIRLYRDSQAQYWFARFELDAPHVEQFPFWQQGDYWYCKGRLAYRNFRPREALHYLTQALKTYQTAYGDRHRCVAETMNTIGLLHFDFTRKSDSANTYILAAREVYLSTPGLQKIRRENELAAGLVRLSDRDHEIGQAYAEVCLLLAGEAPWKDTLFYARSLCLLGNLLKKQGRRADADAYFQQAVNMTNGMRDLRCQEFYRDWIVNLIRPDTLNRTDFDRRMAALQQLLRQQKADRYAHPDRLRGYWYYRSGQYRKAVDIYRTFVAGADSLTNPFLLEEASYVLASAYLQLAATENSPQLVDSALSYVRYSFQFGTPNVEKMPVLEALFSPDVYRHVDNPSVWLDFLGKGLAARYRYQGRTDDLWSALEVFALTDSLLLPGVRAMNEGALLTFQFDVGDDTYAEALEVAWQCHQLAPGAARPLDLAFRFCERMKSYILFRDLGARERDSIGGLKKEIKGLLKTGRGVSDGRIAQRLTAAAEQYEAILSRYRDESERYYRDKVLQTLPPLDVVRATLAPQQAIVAYSVNEKQIYSILITRDTVGLAQMPAPPVLLLASAFRSYLAAKESNTPEEQKQFESNARELYQKLLAGFDRHLSGKTELVLVPDRSLHQIPFEAFLTELPRPGAPAPYLLTRFEVSYSPSWKIWAQHQNSAGLPAQPRALVFAHTDGRSDLPYSADEVEQIRRCFGQPHTVLALNDDCTENNFLQQPGLKGFDLIHFSLHARSDLSDRGGHYVLFGARDTLYGYELSDCRLGARLVVLSACETALGNADAGEGAFSLSRAFLEAGALQVVATLWPVDNGANAALMEHFYQTLHAGATPARALREAKLRMMRGKVADWAGVVAVG